MRNILLMILLSVNIAALSHANDDTRHTKCKEAYNDAEYDDIDAYANDVDESELNGWCPNDKEAKRYNLDARYDDNQ